MKDTNKSRIALHPIIDHAMYLVEMHEHNVILCEDMIEWNEEDKALVAYSEDESAFNQNWLGLREVDTDYEDYIRKELKYHKEELKNQKILLRVCIEAFNGGWIF